MSSTVVNDIKENKMAYHCGSGLEVLGGASIRLSRKMLFGCGKDVVLEEKREELGLDSEDEFVPRVEDVSLVDGVLEGTFGGEGGDDFVVGESV
ncbi:hypothetical protein Tco_1279558 [Tanacetum coccineum]